MKPMITIEPDRRGILAGLFAGHKRQRMLIDGALEGRYGLVMADSEQEPMKKSDPSEHLPA